MHWDDEVLTVRQEAFVRLYVQYGDGQRAAIEAGYSAKSAASMGSHLLKQRGVRIAIDRLRWARLRARDITPERILEEYRRIAFSDARTLHHQDGSMRGPHEWDDDTAATIAGLEVSQVRSTALGLSASISESDIDSTQGNGAGALTRVEERTVKVKRYDKLKALDQLARITQLTSDAGGSPTARMDAPLNPDQLHRMDDDELQSVLAAARTLSTALVKRPT
jgi:hypothetical protein